MSSLNNAKDITIEYDYGSYIGGIPKRRGSNNIDLVYRGGFCGYLLFLTYWVVKNLYLY